MPKTPEPEYLKSSRKMCRDYRRANRKWFSEILSYLILGVLVLLALAVYTHPAHP